MKFGVIGAGIVGVATARAIQQRWPSARVLLLEKESAPALHQSGRNSGVIHAGVYYPPNSLKADFCRRGMAATYAYADAHQIPCRNTGKLIVAAHESELKAMHALADRAAHNGIVVQPLCASDLQRREAAVSGAGALWVPASGIVDYGAQVCAMVAEFTDAGGSLLLNSCVQHIDERASGINLRLTNGEQCRVDALIVCGGLQADRLIRAQGLVPDFSILPFRGEYYRVRSGAVTLSHLIYPVPDPELPFLGVHLTLMTNGAITAGPNAVLGLQREGYGQAHQMNTHWQDVWSLLFYPGFWRLLARYPGAALREWRDSCWRRGYLRRLQSYCPTLTLQDLQPWPTGIRAQAVLANGELVQDFHFMQTDRTLHVCSAPSPAATSAFPIAQYLIQKLEAQLP
ncbi:L-2-hydroxyglutarate oxidase [Simiduia aestuariiviva]|uniref:L-2-hydroxyglutarate oxidase n=1 Tax=Simiduia aestuariiviva TaxID=1510459 RepID=A0A839ULG7_9GAMM|nr:L-2-hydroxyglutarate oxidase [Simiduia aestuariiviva]MBB3167601.1 L-2-hydroxyglutarate oxidase [Simiduia aestuariiviva]